MRRTALLTIASFLAALSAAPTAWSAEKARVTTIELAATGDRSYSLPGAGPRFTLAGLHWRGPGRVLFRTRSVAGRWSSWQEAAPEDEDGPDAAESKATTRGWRVGNPWWVGLSERIEARALGRVSRIRAHLVWSPEVRVPYRSPATTTTPSIVPRLAWGADESIRRAAPSYATDVRLAIVHHTAGRNDYTRSEAPAIVRGIQLYHVQGNGWNDIGYNFLVDRFGTIYEGRFGGSDRNVVGAHAQGFNTGSVGIALLGTYGNVAPSAAAQDAIARLLAWRLDLAHVDPTAFLSFIAGGNERYAAGIPVLLSAVAGHRDTGFTECPGNALYARLGDLAARARSIGGAKIFAPTVEASSAAVRFRATLSRAQPWTVTVTNAAGVEVARGEGAGAAVDWTWESISVAPGAYTWLITSSSAHPASGTVRTGGAAPLAIEDATTEFEAVSPNGDGQADATLLTYRITTAANVTVAITDSIGGLVATVVDRVWTQAGTHSALVTADELADGRYDLVVTARLAGGPSVQKVLPLTVSRTLGFVDVTPAVFSPNGDGRRDRLAITFSVTTSTAVRIRVVREGKWVASPFSGTVLPGARTVAWDGRRIRGSLRDGSYEAIVETRDSFGLVGYGVPFVSDTTAPLVRVLPGRRLRVQVSEPAILQLRIDGARLRREVKRGGVVRIPWSGPGRRVRVVAWDAAGNRSVTVVRVRRTG